MASFKLMPTFTNCEVCQNRTEMNTESIMQVCHECRDLFELEMSKIELDEMFDDLNSNPVTEKVLNERAKRQRPK